MPFTPKLTLDEIREFHRALLSAFRQKSALERMVGLELGQNLNTFVADGPLNTMVYNLVQWAVDGGRDADLLAAAMDQNNGNPGNPDLKAFAAKMANRVTTGTATALAGPDVGIGGGNGPQSIPPNSPPVTPAPVLPASNKLSFDDKARVQLLIQRAFSRVLTDPGARVRFMEDAGLSDQLLDNFNWGGSPADTASQLIQMAQDQGVPQDGRPGYTVLGAVLDQLISRKLVGADNAQYLSDVIDRYHLIRPAELHESTPWKNLQTLMESAPVGGQAEAFVRAGKGLNSYLDSVVLKRAVAACRPVCRIETPKQFGTGFLVAPNLLLTNHHVLKEVITDRSLASQVKVRFDYTRKDDGALEHWVEVHLADDWLIDYSSYTNEPFDGLDYALVKLVGSPGTDPAADGPLRGWLKPSLDPHTFVPGDDLYIVQHPDLKSLQTAPQQVVTAPNSVVEVNKDRTRLWYQTNTEVGSSGSPCFTVEWLPVALHHGKYMDPQQPNGPPKYNEGIPLDTIYAQPKVKAALGL
ncbi:MAG: serine protease [Chloroflexota bacterium]|nr:serine protease [Chloroflexota bacterium]